MKILKYIFRIIGLNSILELIEQHEICAKSKLEGIVVTIVNISLFIRFYFLWLSIYTDDPSWIKYDHSIQYVAILKFNFLMLGSVTLLIVFASVMAYLNYFSKNTENLYLITHELLGTNTRDIYYSNQSLWYSIREDILFTSPIDTLRTILLFFKQAYHEGVIKKSHILMRTKYILFPVEYHIVRIQLTIFLIGIQIFYLFTLLSAYSLFILFLYNFQNKHNNFGILLAIFINWCYVIFLIKLHLVIAGLFLIIHLTILLTLKHIRRNILKILNNTKSTWPQVRCIFGKHAQMFNYLIERNRVASQFVTLFFWFTIEFNLIAATDLLLQKVWNSTQIFLLTSLIFHFIILLVTILFDTKITKALHGVHVHFVPIQLKPFYNKMPRFTQVKLMAYYERLNSNHLNAAKIFGLGTITNNNIISFIFLYTMYILITINLIRTK